MSDRPKLEPHSPMFMVTGGDSGPQSALPPVCVIEDDFIRPDALILGVDWEKLSLFHPLGIQFNQCYPTVIGSHNIDRYIACGAQGANQWVQITAAVIPAFEFVGAILRADDVGTFYVFFANASTVSIYKCIASAFTFINSASVTVNSGDVFYFEVNGINLTLKQNTVTVLTGSDNQIDGVIVGGLFMGIDMNGEFPRISAFSGGTLP